MKIFVIKIGYSVIAVAESEEDAKSICKIVSKGFNDATYEVYDTKWFKNGKVPYGVDHMVDKWYAFLIEGNLSDDEDFLSAFDNVVMASSEEEAIRIAQNVDMNQQN